MEFVINCHSNVDMRHTVLSHGWVNLAPWNWDYGNGILCRAERLSSGHTTCIEVSQKESKKVIVKLNANERTFSGNNKFIQTVKRWLSIDWDPKPAILTAEKLSPEVARFIKQGGGRFLRGSTFYEDFVKTICTINASWGFTKKIVSRIVDHIGDGTFPTPDQILDSGQTYLENVIHLGYRANVLIEATNILLEDGIVNRTGESEEEQINYDHLINLRGIGPYAAGHLMVLLHDFSRIPIDSEVIKFCSDTYHIKPNEIAEFFSRWGDYSFLGYKINRIISRTNWIG